MPVLRTASRTPVTSVRPVPLALAALAALAGTLACTTPAAAHTPQPRPAAARDASGPRAAVRDAALPHGAAREAAHGRDAGHGTDGKGEAGPPALGGMALLATGAAFLFARQHHRAVRGRV
ncbi:hypothetical protein [Streptomyces catenulae]|uniref:Uncharacterized protein n=1 Tax=Streptomyces catenulae TaxID=66875 RepID=A0ABV2Z3M5_9ACTN|nr:hypothetical protein [Streptomyces catenulae]